MTELTFVTSFNTYREIEQLGEGGSGRVFKVEDDDGKTFAVKCLDADKSTKDKQRRFKNEIFFSLRNTHEHIVTVLDYGIARIKGKDCSFYVMPFYSSTLRLLIKKGIAPDNVLRYFSQILDGVEAAHLKSVWHRDLKPENILHDPKTDLLVIADFGIAHFGEEYLQTTVETDSNSRLANFRYAAPEQRTVGQIIGQRADIYALGLILYEMFTGMLLQGTRHRPIGSLHPKYAYVDNVVDGMVRQMPEDRFASIDLVKQRLIAYKEEYISRQKLSKLNGTVIPQSDVDDPLVSDPVKVLNVDYQKGNLIFELNHQVSGKWQNAFMNIGNFEYYPGMFAPNRFNLIGNKAVISVNEPNQKMIDFFKDYIAKANAAYAQQRRGEQVEREEAERRRLQEEIAEEEKRQKLLNRLKL